MSKYHKTIIAKLLDHNLLLGVGLVSLIISLEYNFIVAKFLAYLLIISHAIGAVITSFTKPTNHIQETKLEVNDDGIIEIQNGVA